MSIPLLILNMSLKNDFVNIMIIYFLPSVILFSLKSIYCSLIQYLLEYASVLWDPFTIVNSYNLEQVHRLFLSSAAYTLKTDYENPLHDY